jgi:putative PIN family toxin of toxin-antitoxin system
MLKNKIRVVIDTNIWVSMAMGSRVVSEQMAFIIERENIEIFSSIELFDELTETLTKPRLKNYLTQNRTRQLFELIWLKTQLITIQSAMKICRDPKDDFILNLAFDCSAQYIVTGDKDLLVLNPLNALQILTVTDFLQEI